MDIYKINYRYINDYNNLISNFIDENKLNNTDIIDQFKNVKIYELKENKYFLTLDNKLFDLNDIINLLDLSENIEYNYDEDELIEVNVIINNKKYIKKLLTKIGLYRITYQYNTHIGKLFRKFIDFMNDKLFEQKNILISENNLLKKELETSTEINKQLENEYNQLENKYKRLENNLQNSLSWLNCNKSIKLQKKIIPIYIYLEKYSNDISKMVVYNTYNIKKYNELTPPSENEYFIYNIFDKKSNFKDKVLIKTIYCHSNHIYKKLYDIMYDKHNGYFYNYKKKEFLLCTLKEILIEFDIIDE